MKNIECGELTLLDTIMLDGLAHVLSEEFLKDSESLTRRWDKEWMRYFSLGKDYSFYFYDMDTPNYALSVSPNHILEFTPQEMMYTRFIRGIKGMVWAYGGDIVGKDILEMGCGPGLFGRISSRFASSYTGIDVSKFALYIARLTSPKNCSHVHFFDSDSIKGMAKSFDFSFGRNFFIHHNYDDSLWLLKFMRDVTKDNGVILADFFSNEKSVDGHRRVDSATDLNEEHPSALYNFNDADVLSIAEAAGLECESIDYVEKEECRFARFRVPQRK